MAIGSKNSISQSPCTLDEPSRRGRTGSAARQPMDVQLYQPLEGQPDGQRQEPPHTHRQSSTSSTAPRDPAHPRDQRRQHRDGAEEPHTAQPNERTEEQAEERAPLVGGDAEAGRDGSEAAGVERGGVRGAGPGVGAPGRERGCCARRCFALRECKVRGFRLPEFLGLCGSLVLPTADAWLDWSVTIVWYLRGDVHWAAAGLTINLVSGALSGLVLGLVFHDGGDLMGKCKAYPLGVLLGMLGLAPVAWAALVLYWRDTLRGPDGLKLFKALELVFEALPQSVLQCVHRPLANALCGLPAPTRLRTTASPRRALRDLTRRALCAGPSSASPTASSTPPRRASATCCPCPSRSRCSERARRSSALRQRDAPTTVTTCRWARATAWWRCCFTRRRRRRWCSGSRC